MDWAYLMRKISGDEHRNQLNERENTFTANKPLRFSSEQLRSTATKILSYPGLRSAGIARPESEMHIQEMRSH